MPDSFSAGPKALAKLASETGGRVFHDDDSETEIHNDLRIIEADLRNQYRLIYKAADFKHDGSFHRIELQAPDRVKSIAIRSGYYAPSH
jgi:VWFA-related protein